MKKYLWSLGTMISVVGSAAIVVSCGANTNKNVLANINLKKLKIKYNPKIVEPKEIDDEIATLNKKHPLWVNTTTPIIFGNLVNFDFSGFLNGKQFNGGTKNGYEMIIGSHTFIPGFEEQMKGMNIGDKKEIHITFPATYQSKELAGKAVIFKVKVNNIKTNTINDAFAASLKFPNINTLQDLKDAIKDSFINRNTLKARETFIDQIIAQISKKINLKQLSTNEEINHEVKKLYSSFLKELATRNIPVAPYLKSINSSEKLYKKALENNAKELLKKKHIIVLIAKKENIVVFNGEYKTRIEKLALLNHIPVEEVEKVISKPDIKFSILLQKVEDKLIAYSKTK